MPARILILLVLLLGLATAATAHGSVTVTSEQYSLRPGPYTPDCLAEDDILDFTLGNASGSLTQGESFTFTPQMNSCESRTVYGTFVFRGVHNNNHPDVNVTLAVDGTCTTGCGTFHDDGVQYTSTFDCFFGKPCWKGTFCATYQAAAQPDGSGRNQMHLTVSDTGPGNAPFVYVIGMNTMWWAHTC